MRPAVNVIFLKPHQLSFIQVRRVYAQKSIECPWSLSSAVGSISALSSPAAHRLSLLKEVGRFFRRSLSRAGTTETTLGSVSTGLAILKLLSGIVPIPQLYGKTEKSAGVQLADARLGNIENLCYLLHCHILLIVKQYYLAFAFVELADCLCKLSCQL
jgi:hypothetical protein